MNRHGISIFVLRVSLGLCLAFAGLHKFLPSLLDPAHNKAFSAAGFLKGATAGQWLDSKGVVNPTHDLWVAIGGNVSLMSVVDTLVVFGEIACGIALILGLATRFSAVMGAILIGMILVAGWSFANGPFNEAFFYVVIGGFIAVVGSGAYALDTAIAKIPVMQKIPVIKYALG